MKLDLKSIGLKKKLVFKRYITKKQEGAKMASSRVKSS